MSEKQKRKFEYLIQHHGKHERNAGTPDDDSKRLPDRGQAGISEFGDRIKP